MDPSLFMNSRSSSTPSMGGSSVLFSLRKPCRAGQDPESNGRQSELVVLMKQALGAVSHFVF